jgi:hypothetical protein
VAKWVLQCGNPILFQSLRSEAGRPANCRFKSLPAAFGKYNPELAENARGLLWGRNSAKRAFWAARQGGTGRGRGGKVVSREAVSVFWMFRKSSRRWLWIEVFETAILKAFKLLIINGCIRRHEVFWPVFRKSLLWLYRSGDLRDCYCETRKVASHNPLNLLGLAREAGMGRFANLGRWLAACR